ncbi:MAG: DinB family protein [Chloroflexi bacterium]|nr:DinB family protein [Chloroflexota bacterium]MQC83236.1 DinB family protein [Chloroflexota bacterium]
MDATETIRTAIDHAHGWFEGTCADLTAEQAAYVPAGTAHPISEIVTHVVQSEDFIVNSMILGQPSVWDTGGWEQKLGLPNVSRHTQEQAKSFTADLAALQPYKEAVYVSVASFVDGLTPQELEREIQGPAGPMRVVDALTNALLGNTLAHTGEISALKGVQGATGYPF